MSSAKRITTLAQLCKRQYCSMGVTNPSSRFKNLKANQARFQCDDGLPVHLKGGFKDKLLYQATWVGIFVGIGMMSKLFWDLAVPKKN